MRLLKDSVNTVAPLQQRTVSSFLQGDVSSYILACDRMPRNDRRMRTVRQ